MWPRTCDQVPHSCPFVFIGGSQLHQYAFLNITSVRARILKSKASDQFSR